MMTRKLNYNQVPRVLNKKNHLILKMQAKRTTLKIAHENLKYTNHSADINCHSNIIIKILDIIIIINEL